jgi:hypothetical protein
MRRIAKVILFAAGLVVLDQAVLAQTAAARGKVSVRQQTVAEPRVPDTQQAKAGPLSYAVAPTPDYTATNFGILDIGMGTFHPISTTPTLAYGILKDARSKLYFQDVAGDLYSINPGNGKAAKVGGTGTTPGAFANTADGILYTLDVQNVLYRLDAETGAATKVGATGIAPFDPTVSPFAVSFAGDCQYLYYILAVYGTYPDFDLFPTLWRIDPHTAQAVSVGLIVPPLPFFGSGFIHDKLFAFSFDEKFRGGPGPKTYQVDVTTGAATFVSDLNVASVYGAVPLGEGNAKHCAASGQ